MRQRVLALLLGVVVCVMFVTREASALPPPKSETELMAMADLVVDALCVAIVCDGAPVEDAEKIVTSYQSTLEPSQVYKGSMPAMFVVEGYVEEWKNGSATPGGWHQTPVAEGWSGKLYLQQNANGTYSEVWWNGMEEDSTSDPQPLPSCVVADAGVDAETDASPDAAQEAGEPDATGTDANELDVAVDASADAGTVDGGESDSGSSPVQQTQASEDDGCSCGVVGVGPRTSAVWLLLLVGLLGLGRRLSQADSTT